MDNNIEISKKEIVIVYNDKDSYFARIIQKRGYRVLSAYRKTNLFLRVLRKVHFRSNLPFRKIWYYSNAELKNYNTIIIFDAALASDFVERVRKDCPDKRIILWYWNPLRNSINPKLLSDDICERWTYSDKDSKKYGFKYNTTFYFKELTAKGSRQDYDIFFVGRDKGRLNLLLEYKKRFEDMGLKTYFHITPTKWYMLKSNPIYKENISYDDILDEISKSKAILDIIQNPDDGLTLRTMESIFLNKKLITNNKIVTNYDFYHPRNMFILGEDNLDNLYEFLNSSYKKVDQNIVKKYDFNFWIKRFYD